VLLLRVCIVIFATYIRPVARGEGEPPHRKF